METLQTERKVTLQFSSNQLKVLGAVSMTIDHIGFLLLPDLPALRHIGRIALPIFAFMIAEGCCHTRNRLRYFLQILLLALVCQGAYTLTTGDWFLCVPVSFSMAIPTVYTLQAWKRAMCRGNAGAKLLWSGALAAAVTGVYLLTWFVGVDYGFWGCMLPVAASLFRAEPDAPRWLKKLDRNLVHVLALAVCMVPLALEKGAWQWWSMLALPFLKLYSGQRGKYKMKYFFYIFYPAHLLIIEALYLLLF